jgi:uncharacterized protein (DUF608 family)
MARPFTGADFDKLVPADKKLDPGWVSSLTTRGERTIYRGADLEKIGMPIGGLFAGQIYLGGDGKLWHWDIFNQHTGTGADHYARPLRPSSPLEQGFAIRIRSAAGTQDRILDRSRWRDISFCGEYPIGFVEYREPESPVTVRLEAFSPFIPLNSDDSSMPATVLEFTVRNESPIPVEVEFAGWLQNAVCLFSGASRLGQRRNRIVRDPAFWLLECSAQEAPPAGKASRPDILFEDFEQESYGDWTATGTAFGSRPAPLEKVPGYQGDLGGKGKRVVNTHASAPGLTVEERDSATGTLTSRAFVVERNYINFLIGGGAHAGKTCMKLLVDDKVVLSATGKNNNHMEPLSWRVEPWLGKTARLQIVDQESGPWGNIGIDDIVFSDEPRRPIGRLSEEKDFGTLGLALLEPRSEDSATALIAEQDLPASAFSAKTGGASQQATKPLDQKLVGALRRILKLGPNASGTATFVLSWHMPNLKLDRLPPGRHYATRFDSAHAVTRYLAANYKRLAAETRLWHQTWYDSTLPHWFLERTFLNTSILATSTCYRFADGRFYGWEGVGCCEGTCGHVWQYSHALARLFPELERVTREKVDFGLALRPDGAIHFRGEFNDIPAIDAQAGTILRALREHHMSPDNSFLKRNWPSIKRAMEWLIAKDGNGDGLIEGNQHNTLDTDWFGPVAWLSGLYLGALRAAEAMANETGDAEFAQKCRRILELGQQKLVSELFDGEYFSNKPDPGHLGAINSGSGCEIDQVFGQSWAFQVGLPRVLPKEQTVVALKSLWRYNFTPDVGPYRAAYKAGRWYAMPGEAGLLMCTFPRADWDYAQAKGKGPEWAAGYFNECMNGFEYQVAGHMLWEGLVTEGLAVTRAVHDRYHAARRNPWNEVECGDHYARSMASYGVFLAACGFEYHGPNGHLGFAPRMFATPQAALNAPGTERATRFKSAFTTAEGWGAYSEESSATDTNFKIELKWGKVRLETLALVVPNGFRKNSVRVRANGRAIRSSVTREGKRLNIALSQLLELKAGGVLEVSVRV